jgi:hypothetical protein
MYASQKKPPPPKAPKPKAKSAASDEDDGAAGEGAAGPLPAVEFDIASGSDFESVVERPKPKAKSAASDRRLDHNETQSPVTYEDDGAGERAASRAAAEAAFDALDVEGNGVIDRCRPALARGRPAPR